MNYPNVILCAFVFAACAPPAANPAPAEPSTGGSSAALPADYQAALEPLRPPGSGPSLAALRADRSASAYADAAIHYADTDAAGMTLLWGMTSCALNADAPHGDAVARAMQGVLVRRVTRNDGELSIRLAPGATPALQRGGEVFIPLAYFFEQFMGAALAGSSGVRESDGWSANALAEAWSNYLQLSARAAEYNSAVDLHAWLARLAGEGHLAGFVAHAFRLPAAEASIQAAREWALAHPLVVQRVTLPDDLVQMSAD